MDLAMQHHGKLSIAKSAKEFLALAERITEQHGRLIVIKSFMTKANHPFQDFFERRKLIPRLPESRFHDENVRRARLATLSGQPLPKFEIAGIKEGSAAGFHVGHGTAENMPRRKKCQVPGSIMGVKRCSLVQIE